MIKSPESFFLPQNNKETTPAQPLQRHPLDGKLCDDIEGVIDNAWHKTMRAYVPEIIWNPDHPDRTNQSTKGGPGSGNWGHQGLEGVHGGSSPTKTAPSLKPWREVSTVEEKTDLSNAKGDKNYNHIKKVAGKMAGFCGTDPETGYRVDCRRIKAFKRESQSGEPIIELNYHGDIYDNEGMPIGEVDLSYLPNTNSGDINLIIITQPSRKTGFGRHYINHVENVFFDDIGVEKIHLLAALDVGGYFWARAGYDFIKPGEKRWAIEWLGREWEYRYNKPVPQNILKNLNHTWDIAALIGPDGFRIGKQTMLGVSWRGEKTPDGIGREIGKEYYKLD